MHVNSEEAVTRRSSVKDFIGKNLRLSLSVIKELTSVQAKNFQNNIFCRTLPADCFSLMSLKKKKILLWQNKCFKSEEMKDVVVSSNVPNFAREHLRDPYCQLQNIIS